MFSNKEARSSLTAHLRFCYVAMFQVFSLKVNKIEIDSPKKITVS